MSAAPSTPAPGYTERLARANFEAYAQRVLRSRPEWANLSDEERAAWYEGARAAIAANDHLRLDAPFVPRLARRLR